MLQADSRSATPAAGERRFLYVLDLHDLQVHQGFVPEEESMSDDTVDRGDHTVYVAEVVGAGVRDASRAPLDLRSTGMNYGG